MHCRTLQFDSSWVGVELQRSPLHHVITSHWHWKSFTGRRCTTVQAGSAEFESKRWPLSSIHQRRHDAVKTPVFTIYALPITLTTLYHERGQSSERELLMLLDRLNEMHFVRYFLHLLRTVVIFVKKTTYRTWRTYVTKIAQQPIYVSHVLWCTKFHSYVNLQNVNSLLTFWHLLSFITLRRTTRLGRQWVQSDCMKR